MEKVETLPQKKIRLFEKLVFKVLKNFKKGRLHLVMPDGHNVTFGRDDSMTAHVSIKDNRFFEKVIFEGDIGFGDAFMLGYWDTPNLVDVIKWMILNIEDSGVMSGSKSKTSIINLLGYINRMKHLLNKNSKTKSKENISYHYDLSNDFFSEWLDETMTYSSGIFDGQDSLKVAQENKYERICQKINLKSTDHVLEIGCGWAGFAEYAASKYGCQITGITISKEQLKFAQERIEKAGLSDKVELRIQDYRDVEEKFDKVVSIEMVEAVGHEYMKDYLGKISEVLKPNGMVCIQAITSPDSRYDEFRKGVDWIQKRIFPGSLLQSVGNIVKVFNQVGDLQLYDLYDFGHDYARTLNTWKERFFNKVPQIKEMGFDRNFVRMWDYYLSYCEAAFFMRNISVVQLTFTRPNNTSIN